LSLPVKAGQYRTPYDRETGHPFTVSGNYEFDPAGFELLRRAIERVGGDTPEGDTPEGEGDTPEGEGEGEGAETG